MVNKASSKQGKHSKGHEKEFTEQLLEQPYIHKVIDWCTANLKIIGIVAGIIVLLVVIQGAPISRIRQSGGILVALNAMIILITTLQME